MAARFKPPREIKVEKLLLDEKNPRIPPVKQSLLQDDLAVYVAETYFALAVARSIAAHGYFSSEPLIAIKAAKAGFFTVVEGNRRLSALKLLLRPQLREKLTDRTEWDALAAENVPTKVPVVVVETRRDVAPVIGYRHTLVVWECEIYDSNLGRRLSKFLSETPLSRHREKLKEQM